MFLLALFELTWDFDSGINEEGRTCMTVEAKFIFLLIRLMPESGVKLQSLRNWINNFHLLVSTLKQDFCELLDPLYRFLGM